MAVRVPLCVNLVVHWQVTLFEAALVRGGQATHVVVFAAHVSPGHDAQGASQLAGLVLGEHTMHIPSRTTGGKVAQFAVVIEVASGVCLTRL